MRALLAVCGEHLAGLPDATLFCLAYDGWPRVSELVGAQVEDLTWFADSRLGLVLAFYVGPEF